MCCQALPRYFYITYLKEPNTQGIFSFLFYYTNAFHTKCCDGGKQSALHMHMLIKKEVERLLLFFLGKLNGQCVILSIQGEDESVRMDGLWEAQIGL